MKSLSLSLSLHDDFSLSFFSAAWFSVSKKDVLSRVS